MSLTATVRPSSFSLNRPPRNGREESRPFHHEPAYLNLKRQLLRYQHLLLLTPAPDSEPTDELTPVQRQIQAELWSPLPYHRTKWLHNVEGARNLLLQLERTAQQIKVQRTRQTAQKDLAEKRMVIKKLKNRVEEIGREVEAMGEEAWKLPLPDIPGETAWDMLQKDKAPTQAEEIQKADGMLREGKPVQQVEEEIEQGNEKRDQLFKSSGTIRRRNKEQSDITQGSRGQTSGYSGVDSNERAMLDDSKTQEDLTTSMISMAVQLKQQTKAFQFSLDQDKGLLDRALEGLDRNLSGMEAASKRMQFLKRMSEEQGFFGRLKLYFMIMGMWFLAILLVFAGPKLRF